MSLTLGERDSTAVRVHQEILVQSLQDLYLLGLLQLSTTTSIKVYEMVYLLNGQRIILALGQFLSCVVHVFFFSHLLSLKLHLDYLYSTL